MAPLEIRHRSVRPISAKHAQASRFLQQSPRDNDLRGAEVITDPKGDRKRRANEQDDPDLYVRKIGRASCRERVCQYVSISVVAVSLKKKICRTCTQQRAHKKT